MYSKGQKPSILSVKRCLFGKPENDDNFLEEKERKENEDVLRFQSKWNFDVVSDCAQDGEYQWTKPSENALLPKMYTKTYHQCHKHKKRRYRRSAHRRLSFTNHDDQENHRENRINTPSPILRRRHRPNSPAVTHVDVFVGISVGLPALSAQLPVTPATKGTTSSLVNNTPTKPTQNAMNKQHVFGNRKLSQMLLTDVWAHHKKTAQRTSPPPSHVPAKRRRLESP